MKNLIAMYIDMQSRIQAQLKDEKGATMVEYALMVALIAVACVVTVTAVGASANAMFTSIAGSI